jgi:mannonate dehydratase
VYDYQSLIKEQLIDYVRAASTHFGGISPLKKVMDFAAQYQIKSGFHGPTDISPVGFAAQLHVGLATTTTASRNTCSTPPPPTRCLSSP